MAARVEIQRLILAEFGAASLLIAAGALLGELRCISTSSWDCLFVPCYMLNEWIILIMAWVVKKRVADTGGSIIHSLPSEPVGVGAAIP